VTLILGEGENLKIDEKITSINYSDSGEEVTIGATKTVSQQTLKNNKLVYNTLIVPYGKRSKIQLSDGSIVWLNSGSRLVYPIVFKGEKREVHLEGEGIFEVAYNKNQPFIVISQNQEAEVLGTVFGITNYLDENSINTVLKSGSVQISYTNALSSNSDKMKITPGTIASYNKKSKAIISEKVNVDQYFSWRDGVLIFKNNDLKFIMKKLSRYYNIEIEISEFKYNKDNEGETFSGYLDLNEDLDKVIKNIQMSTNMKYRFIENKLIIN
jgi:ferric-dicitrate binding protein FerR (iron transport regulator)